MKRLLLLVLVLAIPSLSTAAVTNSFWNVSTSNLVVKAINLNGSNITDWSQIGGGGAGSVTNIAAGYGISISSGYGPEATVTVNTNVIASQAWVTGLGYAPTNGLATIASLGGYVQTQELTNASNTLWQATASKAATNAPLTGFSSGSATSNQTLYANGTSGTFWATPGAGGATTPATNDVRWLVDSTYPNTINDLVGFAPHSFLPSQASATAPIVDGPTLYNAATNNWTMLLALRYQREVTGSNLQWSVLRSGESSTFTSNYTVRVVYTNTLTGAAWAGTLFTNTIASVNTWTNQTLTDTVLTNLPVGSFPQLIFTVPVSATNGASTPAYWMIRNGGNQW